MFRPDSNRDRTDYSGILMPPDGYRLDRAVGTTYSLDLEALTAVAICLGLSEETDSKLMQNPIGMLQPPISLILILISKNVLTELTGRVMDVE